MIAIAGIGGIGSNAAQNLIRFGISSLLIGDFDCVEESNLNRQFYFYDQIGQKKTDSLEINLKRINPSAVIYKMNKKFIFPEDINLFEECEIIIEGFDQVSDKISLIETFSNTDKKIISANGIAGFYSDKITVRKGNQVWIVGDFQSEITKNPTYSHKVQIIACKMAEIAIKEGGFLA